MNILTPSGYKDISTCSVGDEVCAFDLVTGAPIVNTIETLQWVDATEWARWWEVEDTTPPFQFYLINGTWTINSEQSIWRNGTNVCHARDLVVGDVLYDGNDHDVTITSIEEVAADGWWRFDISGDHSYIVDDLTLHNASRFWVGGTGTWDSSTTTHWASSTGGAGGQSVPGSADTVTLDGSSGGGTVTLNFGGTITIQSYAGGAHTGTFDNSVNNNNMTLSAGVGFNSSGAGTRTVKLGTATYSLTATTAQWNFVTTTGLTFTGNLDTINFTGGAGTKIFSGGALSHGNVTFGATSGGGFYQVAGANTLASLTITPPNYVQWPNSITNTITAAFSFAGTSSTEIGFVSNNLGAAATIAAAAGSLASWMAFRDMAFSGNVPVASNSFDLGNNSGITVKIPFIASAPVVVGRGAPY